MDITLEMIDLLRDRTGADYREVREALEHTGGSMQEALSYLENEREDAAGAAKDSLKEVYSRWMDTRLEVRTADRASLFSLPLFWGIVGAAAFPRYTAWGILGLLLARGSLGVSRAQEEEKEDEE